MPKSIEAALPDMATRTGSFYTEWRIQFDTTPQWRQQNTQQQLCKKQPQLKQNANVALRMRHYANIQLQINTACKCDVIFSGTISSSVFFGVSAYADLAWILAGKWEGGSKCDNGVNAVDLHPLFLQ